MLWQLIRTVTTSTTILNNCKPKSQRTPVFQFFEKHENTTRKVFSVYRYDGIQSNEKPRIQRYEFDTESCGRMMLHALQKMKEMDPSLTFRQSCREGICGSCAVNVNGQNCLACITRIPNTREIKIYPLPHMYVIRDLVVDMSHFFEGLKHIKPYLQRLGPLGREQLAQSVCDSQKLVGLYECILCACCSTSCPSYWWNGRRFLGPAALLHAYRWIVDSRDTATRHRLLNLSDDFKAFRCHNIMNCSVVCPKNLHPGKIMMKLKRMIGQLDKKPPPDMEPTHFMRKKYYKTCKGKK